MAARTREPAAVRKAREAADAQEIPAEIQMVPENGNGVPDGVLVSKVQNPDGGLGFNVQVVGNAQITEIDFILEMGRRVFRRQIGLDEQK